ncbi:MAG TPA: Ig-like domain-containing protein [Candidatus Angelobacter sp.]|nr:Ig-like domain-containing protein [Candidatus Angelobacter sp.]
MKNYVLRTNKHLIGFLLAVAGLSYGLALPLRYFPGLLASGANTATSEASGASPAMFIPGPNISAVKSHSPAGPFHLGDTITYSTTVSNTGAANGTGVTFTDTPDANTTLVAGSIQASPVAANDSYTATGNVEISVPVGSGVLVNDFPGLNPTATITAFDAISANGGAVVITTAGANAGAFTYNPPPGFTGTDTFTYTLSNSVGSSVGTVTITVSNMIWFINDAAAAGDGRLQSPFNSLAAFAAVNDGVGRHPKSGNSIFIYQGTGSYTGPLTLLTNQRLIGQGDPLSSTTLGFTPDANGLALPGATAKPTLTGTITLASGVNVKGFDLSTAGSNGIVGSGGLAGITVGDSPNTATNGLTVTTTTGTAVSLNNVGGTFTFLSISANGGANGISLISTTGSFAVTGDGATANSGGTIQHNTGANQTTAGTGSQGIGLYMSTAQNVALSWMHLHDFDNFAIQGTSVTNFTLDHTTVDGVNGNSLSITPNSSGQSSGEGAVQFYDLLGTSAFTNCTISGGKYDTVQIIEMSGSLSSLTVNNCTISQSDTTGNTAFAIFAPSNSVSSTINATITNNTFPRAHGNLLDIINNGTAAMSTTITSNIFSDSDATTAGGGVHVAQTGHSAGSSNLTFDIETNTFGGTAANGFNSTCVTAALHVEKPVPTPLVTTTATGKIIGNQFGTTGHAGSSTSVGAGSDAFQIDNDGNGSFTVLVKNNNIHGFDENAISMFAEQGNTLLNATVIGNTMDTINGASPNNLSGLFMAVGAQASDTNNACLHIGQVLGGEVVADKNSINAAGASGGFVSDVILESFGTDLITLPSYPGPTNDSGGQVETYWTNANTLSDASQVTVAVNTPNFHNTTPGGTDCAQPPLKFATGGVEAATPELRVVTSGPSALKQEQLDSIVEAARQRWMTAGLTRNQVAVLGALQFEVSDLAKEYIGSAGEHVTLVDRKGAGHGWFVDANPLADAAFSKAVSPSWLYADPGSPAAGHLDLLTAVMHEMGHRLGMGDKSAERNRGHIMYGELSVGERRLPVKNDWTLIQAHTLLSGEAAPDSETDDILRAVKGENADKDDAAKQPKLTSPDLSWIAQAAIARWQEAGISSDEVMRLQGLKLEIIDLPGDQLVVNAGTTGVQVDENAAGHGWFVDPSPQDDSKFALSIFDREFQADLDSAPFSHIDLLTAMMHAFGRILGKDEEHATDLAQAWLMKSWLSTGTRRVPRADAAHWNKNAQAAPKKSGKVARNSHKHSGNQAEAALKVQQSSPRAQYAAYNRSGRRPTLTPVAFHSAQARNLAPMAAMSPAMFFVPTVSVSIGVLPVGKSVIIVFAVTINNPLTSPANATSIVNTGQVSGTNFATVNTNTDTANLCVPPVVATPLTNQQVAQGATATFTTTLTGSAPFTSVWKKNGATLVSGASLGGRATITNSTVGNNTTTTLTITGAIPSDADTYTVDSSDAAACGDTVPTQTATLKVVSTVTISKAFGATTIPLNATTSLTLTLNNPNTNGTALTGLAFTDNLPAGLAISTPNNLVNSGCGGTATATAGSGTVTLSAGTLAAGASCTITMNVTGTTAGVKNNTTGAPSSNEGSTGVASNTATVTVVAPPTISKAFGAATIPLNGATSLTFTISNSSATAALSGVGFTDNLPAGLVIATPNGLSALTGCGGGASVSSTQNTGTINLSAATVAASGTCTFSVNVTGTTAGSLSNTTGTVSSTEGGTGTTSNTAPLTVVAPPTISKAFGAASIVLNGTTTLTFTITNPAANTVAENGVGFSDTLQSGLQVASTPGVVNTCGGTPVATAASTVISLTTGTITTPGTTCTLTVNVTGTLSGIVSNTSSPASSTNGGAGAVSNTATLTVASPPTINKVFGTSSVPLNGSTSLTFTITNPNANIALTGIAFTDALPAGLAVSSPSGLTNTGCGGTATATAGSGTVSLMTGTLASSGSCTITVNVTGTTAGVRNNSTQVTSTEGGTGNTTNASITVVGAPSIIKVFGAASVQLNSTTTLQFTIQNGNTTQSLSGVGFTDTLPGGLVVSTPNGLTGSCGAGAITAVAGNNSINLTGGMIAANSSCTFTINVTGVSGGTKNNTTSNVTSTEGGTGGTASASVDVVAPPAILKAFGSANVPLNGTSSLTFTITNPAVNGVAQVGVAFTDALPAGIVVATPNGLISTCGGTATATAGSGSITLTGGGIAVNSSCTVSVNVTGVTAGIYTNSTTVTSTNGGTGNTTTANLSVATPPTISKAFGAATIPLNATTSLTFTINNPNTSLALTGFLFTDSLPAGLVVATPSGLSNTCGGTATATAGSSVVSLTGAGVPANALCTISLNVQGASAGVKNNTTGVVAANESGPGTTSNTATIAVVAAAGISKAFGAANIPLTGTTSLTFTLNNPNATVALIGVGFTDTLPAGLVVATPNGLTGSCGGGTITAAAGSGSVTLTGATLAASASCTFAVNVRAIAGGAQVNMTGAVTSTNGGAGNAATATITVLLPDLTITKSHAGSFTQGQSVGSAYTITVTNSGTAPTAGTVTVNDSVPAGLAATAISGTGWTCSTLTSCNRNDILANGSSYPPITLTVSVGINAPASVINSVTVSGGGETNIANDTATDVTTITALPGPPLSIALTVSGGGNVTVNPGSPATFVFTVTSGSVLLGGINFTCSTPLPPGSTCSFTNQGETQGTAQTTLTVSTTAPMASNANKPLNIRDTAPLYAALLLPFFGLVQLARRGKKGKSIKLWLAMWLGGLIVLLALAGCGGHPTPLTGGTAQGNYPITVTATSSANPAITATANVSVTVQ